MEKYLKNNRQGDEGLIVNISSVAGVKGYGYMPIYCATKFAVNGKRLLISSDQNIFNYDFTKNMKIS